MQGKDREINEQQRVRERIGSFHKNADQIQINQPFPDSPDFLPNEQRYERDFAAQEKLNRQQKIAKKQEHIERRRLEQFDRDLRRWEHMEQFEQNNQQREEVRRNKYKCGLVTGSSSGYHILNAGYEPSARGQQLQAAEQHKQVRDQIRERDLEQKNNAHYDLFNGKPRNIPQVGSSEKYNADGQY